MILTKKLTKEKRFLLRVPADLHVRLKSAAQDQGISLNRYCIQALGGEGVDRSDLPSLADRRRAHNASLAADHLARAEARQLAIATLVEAESWADVVRESYDVVELALRGLLRWAGLNPSPDREVGGALLAAGKRLPDALAAEVPQLVGTLRGLRRDRDLAFYGSDDVTPWEFYQRHDGETARDAARRTVEVVRAHVLGVKIP